MNVIRAEGHDLRDWAINRADPDMLRLFASESAMDALGVAAAAFFAAYGDDEPGFLSYAKKAWTER